MSVSRFPSFVSRLEGLSSGSCSCPGSLKPATGHELRHLYICIVQSVFYANCGEDLDAIDALRTHPWGHLNSTQLTSSHHCIESRVPGSSHAHSLSL
jgi:hypothetical protein